MDKDGMAKNYFSDGNAYGKIKFEGEYLNGKMEK